MNQSASQFEFLRTIPVGQYLPLDSVLHRIDPRARLMGYLLLLGSLTVTQRLEGILLGLVLILAGMVLGRIPLRYALRGLLTPLPFLLILAVLQVFFNPHLPGSPVVIAVGKVVISLADLGIGARLLVRFFALILGLGLASFTLSTSEISSGLNSLLTPLARLKLPVQDFVMMVQVTLRFLPLLAQTAERIAKAQASRGADWNAKGNLFARVRQILPVIVPLFLISLHRAENMALAMDARAYGSAVVRTSLAQFRFRWKDGLALAATAAAALGVLFL
jgi:energy-coupling factor transport system permease protein